MAKRGRPRASWVHLRDRGAKPSVWRKRKLEDEGPEMPETPFALPSFNPDPEKLDRYLAAVHKEHSTFDSRITPGQTIMNELGNVSFNARTNHGLSQMLS